MRKNVRINKGLLIVLLCLFTFVACPAQNTGLTELSRVVCQLRKASKEVRDKAVLDLSGSARPKITLMDEIHRHANEYRGKKVNRFKMNQIVTYVYERQNQKMSSKGVFFNSTEKDIHYSAIEKNVKKGRMVTYTLTGHVGVQEFMFIPFNPGTVFTAMVDGKKAEQLDGGVLFVRIPYVRKDDVITFSIECSSKTIGNFESFVILNHNPQK